MEDNRVNVSIQEWIYIAESNNNFTSGEKYYLFLTEGIGIMAIDNFKELKAVEKNRFISLEEFRNNKLNDLDI